MIRTPLLRDIPTIGAIINARAAKGLILPRSGNYLYQNIRDFLVAEEGGQVVACGALHVLWGDLGEIRSLASVEGVAEGVEQEIVRALLAEGRRLGLPHVFAFTCQPDFFLALGFRSVERESLPRIAWRECIDCVKFPACDETPVWMDL